LANQYDITKDLQGPYKDLDMQFHNLGDADPALLLITFPLMPGIRTRHLVTCEYEELTALCPWTDMPDQGKMVVKYTPKATLLELKSFKYYLLAFRDRHISQEHLALKIHHDLRVALATDYVKVVLDYWPRGGIHTVFEVGVAELDAYF
jgi:7-cyano-7-deazaguanine reductase